MPYALPFSASVSHFSIEKKLLNKVGYDTASPFPKRSEFFEMLRDMSRITGKVFTSVNIVGGGSENVVLNQMTADVTGLPVYAGPTEGTALGNLAAQMILDGAFVDLAAFRVALPGSFEIKEYLPKK